MVKIYTITLDDEVPLSISENWKFSKNKSDNLRAIAYWINDELSKFDKPILCTDSDYGYHYSGLIKNELNDNITVNDFGYVYSFDSDKESDKKRKFMYDPFIIDDETFGFTVFDGSLSDTELSIILESTLKMLGLRYTFRINSISYDESNIKYRVQAIKEILKNKQLENQPKVKKRSIVLPIVSLLGL